MYFSLPSSRRKPQKRSEPLPATFEPLESRLLLAAPEFASPLVDQWFATDAALTIGVDGYDADADPLTISVESDNPELSWFVPTGNRFARLHFVASDGVTDIGDIVLQLFETRSALAAGRFITLATNYVDPDTGELDPGGVPFYSDVVVHRVIPGFMMQTGDARNGDGTGGSGLGTFADEFDSELSLANAGVLAMANSGANTNDAQFFITHAGTPWLNQAHTVFGHVISGLDVLDTIVNLPRDDNDRPDDPPLLDYVEVLESDQDATVTFTAPADWAGQALVTVTLDDGQGNQTSQSFTIRPAIDNPGTFFATPDETINFIAGFHHDPAASPTLSISSSNSAATVSVDEVTNAVEITVPSNLWGMFEVTLTSTEGDFQRAEESFFVLVNGPDDPAVVGRAPAELYGTAMGIFQANDRLYVAAGTKGLEVFDTSDPANPDLLGTYYDADVIDEIRDVLVVGDIAYAANTFGGLLVLDVADPANITLIDQLDPDVGDPYNQIVTVTVVVEGDRAYVPQYANGLSIFDISDPYSITKLGRAKEIQEGLSLTSAVDVAVKGRYVYITEQALSGSQQGAIVVFDLIDPTNPRFAAGLSLPGQPWGIAVRDDMLYVPVMETGLVAINTRAPTRPRVVGQVAVTGQPWQIALLGDRAVLATNDGFALVVISDPATMMLEQRFSMPTWAQQVSISGNRIAVSDNWAGVVLLDADVLARRVVVDRRVTITDDQGVDVTISVSRAKAIAYTTGAGGGNIERLRIWPISSRASTRITTTRGQTTPIGAIEVVGSMGTLDGRTVELTGDMTVAGTISRLTLGNVDANHTITIGPRPAGDTRTAVTMTFGEVTDTSIFSETPIKSLTAVEWLDGDATADVIQAPWIGRLTTRGRRANLRLGIPGKAGDFQADLDLSGEGATRDTLASARIAGGLSNVAWDVDGSIGMLTIKGTVQDSSIDSSGPIRGITVCDWLDTDATADLIQAPWVSRLTTRGLRANARLGIVGKAGHFQANLLLDGTGARRTTLGSANVAGDLDEVLWYITGAMGRLTVKGTARDSTVRTSGDIAGITLGAASGSDFLAGMSEETYRHAHDAGDFGPTPAQIRSISIRGWRVPREDPIPKFFADSNFSAATIGSVSLLNAELLDGDEFGVFALKTGSGREIRSVRYTDQANRDNNWRWSPRDGDIYADHELVAALVGAAVQFDSPPEIRVEQDGVLILTGLRSQPVEFALGELGEAPVQLIFTVLNIGSENLTIGALTLVDNEGFEISQPPATPILPGEFTTFTLEMLTDTEGNRSATAQIDSNDPDESPFSFQVIGRVGVSEIALSRSGLDVADGEETPIPFGTVEYNATAPEQTFTITNVGEVSLTVENLVLNNNTGFEIVTYPDSSVLPGASTTFVLRMLTDTAGETSADVRFDNNDTDENPFDFQVGGEVLPPQPEIELWRWNPSGDILLADGQTAAVNYGSVGLGGDVRQRTFIIKNVGEADLEVGSIVLENNDGFFVYEQPDPVVPPGGSTGFRIRLSTDSIGQKSADVRFDNNDADENPFNFSVTAMVTPAIDSVVTDLGGGLYGYSLTIRSDDGIQASYFANMTFEGVDGSIVQMKAIIQPGVLEYEVDTDTDAAAYDGLGTPPYDMDRDSYFLGGFAAGDVMALEQSDNYYHIEAGTGVGTLLEDAELAYIACTGQVHFYGTISRQGVTYTVDGTATM